MISLRHYVQLMKRFRGTFIAAMHLLIYSVGRIAVIITVTLQRDP